MNNHPLAGRKQTPEHIRKRVESVARAKALWTPERGELFRQRVSAASNASAPEARAKNAAAHRGRPAWNKGKACPQWSGEQHPMYGKQMTERQREALRQANVGRKQSAEMVQKRVAARRGYRPSEATKEALRQANLQAWARPDIRNKVTGPNSASWLGGLSYEPYPAEWTNNYREQIRQRDKRMCQICGMTERLNGERLCIHHIDNDKRNLSPDNLVSLCKGCHSKTMYHRVQWTQHFRLAQAASRYAG